MFYDNTQLSFRLVDDVATHVRLFKRARMNYRTRKDLSENGKITDLESLFFDAEVSMERDVCRDLVCTIHQEEITFLQDVSELLLFLLLPQASALSNLASFMFVCLTY